MNKPPRRVVSLVPSTTESICELGAASRLVGRTHYCTEPAHHVVHVPPLGGTKNPNIEKILAVEPDLIVGNAEENRQEDLEFLAARVPTLVQTPRSVSEAGKLLGELAQRLGLDGAAKPWQARIDEQVREAANAADTRAPLRVYYAIWRKPWMTVNADTFIHDVLELCGAQCVGAGEATRYPAMEPADAVDRRVDVVLLASEPWEFDASQREEVASTHCFGDAVIRLCDGRDFCWHGVRMAEGLGRARVALQPRSARSRPR